MARAALALLLCGVAAVQAASQPRQQTIRLPQRYGTMTEFNAFSPSVASTTPLPLVLMLSGYCLPADQQDDVRVRHSARLRACRRTLLMSRRVASALRLCGSYGVASPSRLMSRRLLRCNCSTKAW
jgi:hypothetical protein